MDGKNTLLDRVASEAADWFARLREEGTTDADRAEFTHWLLRSPDHISEYMALTRTWGDIGLVQGDDVSPETVVRQALAAPIPENVVSLEKEHLGYRMPREPARDDSPLWRKRISELRMPLSFAAMVLCACALAVWLINDRWRYPSYIQTAIGEQRTAHLADGSIVELNTDSEIRVAFAPQERHIELMRGEARFTVAKNPAQPFIVTTDDARVRAIGTIFNVRRTNRQTSVAVFEGRVAVGAVATEADSAQDRQLAESSTRQPNGSSESTAKQLTPRYRSRVEDSSHVELSAGERVAVLAQGAIVPNAGPPLERLGGWPDHRLIFREETLQVLVDEVNRYHKNPVIIGDPSIASIEISGTFAAADLDSLMEYLKKYRGIHVESDQAGGYVLSRALH